jgi:hypothetical protein
MPSIWLSRLSGKDGTVFQSTESIFVSNVIDFLERFGQDADLQQASREMLEEALRSAGIDPALRAAILGDNRQTLEALVGARPVVCCIVYKEDEEEEEEEEPEEEEDEKERKED